MIVLNPRRAVQQMPLQGSRVVNSKSNWTGVPSAALRALLQAWRA